ncbi:ATP-binding cassette domain-containing protein, partial [Streptomyces sp. NPDC085466]|uniref:ATP-binding cassette domain-containing protein n=1 Tax=Streptomyces sp. NPDC085466 TaxID=3365725 RepID=UPI0037D93F23
NAEFAQARASARRIADVLASPTAVPGGTQAPADTEAGHVRLYGVRLGALRGVDLDLPAGSLTGIVTRDPAAAHDLLLALARETDPTEGRVELDGTPLTDLDPDLLRRAVLVSPHDADLFESSLLDVVRAGANTAQGTDTAEGTDTRTVAAALAASGADEVARVLPHGTATMLGERGRSLSGGQRQRVALARALAADAPVLVLHDPTTAVDTVTESRIATRLRDIRRGRTTILITTSPALLATTERVVVLDGGTVTADGSHAELLATDETYRTAVLA